MAWTGWYPSFAAAMARIPDPVPKSKTDWAAPAFRWAANCSRQNDVVGCWPVPKLKPGSRIIIACPFLGRLLLQLGLISKAEPTSNGRKYRFQDSAQSCRRTLVKRSLAGAMFNPKLLIRSRATPTWALAARFGFSSR